MGEGAAATQLDVGPAGRPTPGIFYTHMCDVYSLGLVLWEVLTGYSAFGELGEKSMTMQRLVPQHLRPAMPSACPAALARAIRACWHPDPHARPPALAMARLLKRMLDAAVELERRM